MAKVIMYRMNDRTLAFEVTDENDAAIDLTGATVYFTVKKKDSDTDSLFEKSSAVITEIDIDDDQVTNKGKGKIFLVPADTATLKAGGYDFDVTVVTAANKRYTVTKECIDFLQPVKTD